MKEYEDKNISYLLIKWELLWNHYKLQNESLEKRRNFLWLIQSALFYGWYQSVDNKIYIAFIIILLGIVINISWIIVLKRDTDAIFLTEECLRDAEYQLNQADNNYSIDRFILDKDILAFHGKYYYKYSFQEISEKKMDDFWEINPNGSSVPNYILFISSIAKFVTNKAKTKSLRKWLSLIFPSCLFFIWILLFIISLLNLGFQLRNML